ncbi:hypothetical protein MMC15_004177 [Xylographa vitiligo]|nr:hypothetical protein [Xylographa vitiligo]
MDKTYSRPSTPPSKTSATAEEYWFWSPSRDIQNKGDNLVSPSSIPEVSTSKTMGSSSSSVDESPGATGPDNSYSPPKFQAFDMIGYNSGGYDNDSSTFFGGSFNRRGYNTDPFSSPISFNPSYTPGTLSPLKRKRGLDTLSLTVTNTSYNIDISDRNNDVEIDDENFELPQAKKAKYHHRTKIITGSGEAEYCFPICQMHAELDISLPVRGCGDCARVETMLSLYAESYQRFRQSIRKEENFFSINSRKAWDKLRCKFANYKFEMDKAVQVSASPPLGKRSRRDTHSKCRLPVQIDPANIPNAEVYRRDIEYRRGSKSYVPGKHADKSGNGHLNTSDPKKQKLDEWKSPPVLPPRRVRNSACPCLRRRNHSQFESYCNHLGDSSHVPNSPPSTWREGQPFLLLRKTLQEHERSDLEDEAERRRYASL